MPAKPVVAITMGDPAGIGSEVIVAASPRVAELANAVVVGDAGVVRDAVAVRGSSLSVATVERVADARFDPGTIEVLEVDGGSGTGRSGAIDDHEYGVVRADYGAASLAYVERVIELATAGAVDAIVTAPINKQATRLAGSEHAGHTGLLAARTGTDVYAMLLVHDDLRVTHVSTHVPLREACDLVTADRVFDTIRVTETGLRDLGIDAPRIAVAGLNPHASDGGLLGETEAETIEPAVRRACEAGIDVTGPSPPDTVFARAAHDGEDAPDCVVAMYHDQGHIPIKMLGFGAGGVTGVNVTVGLPIVRTSVDHGTAFDIAGEGVADETSMVEAVEVAVRMAGERSELSRRRAGRSAVRERDDLDRR